MNDDWMWRDIWRHYFERRRNPRVESYPEPHVVRYGVPSTATKPYVATPTATTVTVRPGILRRLFGQYVEVTTIKGGCDAGLHDAYVGTTGRQGYVNWLYCRRRGCSWTAIEKGRVEL